MTLEVNEDDYGPLMTSAGDDTPLDKIKSVAEAGFEAGLTVITEAIPMPSIVIDKSCQVLASNQAAMPLVDRLARTEFRSALMLAAAEASYCNDPFPLHIAVDGAGAHDYLLTRLSGPYAQKRAMFLVVETATKGTGDANRPTPLQRYEIAPTPVRSLREQALKFKRLSETDPLTGALNVRAFSDCVKQSLAQAPGRKGAMIFLDLNQFKAINDVYGHAAGDKVLVHVAAKLTFPPHTWIVTARMGGDEFALWVPSVDRANLSKVIAGIRARLRVPVDLSEYGTKGSRVTATAAIGAVHCPDEALSYDAMRQLADKRMYDEKSNGNPSQGPTCGERIRKGAVDPAPQSFLPR